MQTLPDSGARHTEDSGATREPDTDRGHYELLPPEAIRRISVHYERGARKYSSRNWEKGLPWGRCIRSLLRHAFQWLAGDKKEDHLAAVVWNAFALMEYEKSYPEGNDLPWAPK